MRDVEGPPERDDRALQWEALLAFACAIARPWWDQAVAASGREAIRRDLAMEAYLDKVGPSADGEGGRMWWPVIAIPPGNALQNGGFISIMHGPHVPAWTAFLADADKTLAIVDRAGAIWPQPGSPEGGWAGAAGGGRYPRSTDAPKPPVGFL